MPWQALKRAVGLWTEGESESSLDRVLSRLGLITADKPSATTKIAFTIAVVTLSAKMSKADGVASEIEAHAFEERFSVPDSEQANVRRLYGLASQDTAGFENYARQINDLLHDEPQLKTSVVECLFHIASADGVLHPSEDEYLHTVANIFELEDHTYRSIRRAYVIDPDSPYVVLDVDPSASDAEIKTRYRELVREHHPDGLVSKGVPPEFLAAATRRLAAVTAAYEDIQRERGQRAPLELEANR